MKTAFHTRGSGKQLTYRIEYDAAGYKIFLRERFLKFGASPRDPRTPAWLSGKEDEHLKLAVEDIEQLRDMPET